MDSETRAVEPSRPSAEYGVQAINASPMTNLIQRLKVLWCNVRLDSTEGRALLESVVVETSVKDMERFGRPFELIAALVQGPNGFDPETGEEYRSPVVTLLMSDGQTMRWASPFVADSLAIMTMSRPSGLFEPPIRFRCVGLKCANTHTRIVLREEKAETASTTPPKRK